MAFISLNTQYKAPTFEEQIRPYLAYTEAYNQMEEGLDTLNQEANKYSAFIDPNSEAYKTIQSYKDELKNLTNTLYEQGMNRNNNFSAVRALRRQFNDEILPINTAVTRLQQYEDEARKLRASGLYVTSVPTIDQYLKDPTSSYKIYDPKILQQQGARLGATELNSSPMMFAITQHLSSTKDVATGIQTISPELRQTVLEHKYPQFQSIVTSMGIDPNDSETYSWAMNQLTSGFLEGAATKTKQEIITNDAKKIQLELNKDLALETERHKNKMEEINARNNGSNTPGYTTLPGNIRVNYQNGDIQGITVVNGNVDPKSKVYYKKYTGNWGSNGDKEIEKRIKSGMNDNNVTTNFTRLDDHNNKTTKKYKVSEIKDINGFGISYRRSGGKDIPYFTARVTLNDNTTFNIEIDPYMVSATNGEQYLKSLSNTINADGGLEKHNKKRLDIRNKLLTTDNGKKVLQKYATSNPDVVNSVLFDNTEMVLANVISEVLGDRYQYPSNTLSEKEDYD